LTERRRQAAVAKGCLNEVKGVFDISAEMVQRMPEESLEVK
jgi:hypothetical protein